GAGGAHGQAGFGFHETPQQNQGDNGDQGKQQHRHLMERQAQVVPGSQYGFFCEQGHVRPAHDAQVHGVERDHGKDGGQQVQNVELYIQDGGYGTGSHAGQHRTAGCQPGIPAFNNQHGGNGGAQGEAAVHRQVGEVEYTKREVDTKGNQAVDQAGFESTVDCNITEHGQFFTVKENGRALLGSARVGQALLVVFDDFDGFLDEVFGQGNAHALGGLRVHVQVQFFHGFNRHVGCAGAFQYAGDHGAGLPAVVVVVEAE